MQQHPSHPVLRSLFAVGFCVLLLGGCIAGFAEGFGDSPPSIPQARRDSLIGIILVFSGAALAVGSAITLDRRDNLPKK